MLFIASNIPTPKRQSNKVVMTIAHKLSTQFDVSVLHPTEFAPFPFNRMKKYRNLADSKPWNDGEIDIVPFKYIRLFGKKLAFLLLPLYKRKAKKYCTHKGIPQLVHAHYALPDGYFAYLLKQTFGIPYVISFRGSDVKLMASGNHGNTMKRMRIVLSQADKIIVHNRAQQMLLEQQGFSSLLMPHGIENHFLKPKQANKPTDELVVTSIGELIPQKHIDWVIHAVKEYQGSKQIILRIAGEGPQKEELMNLASDCRNIQLLGKISHDKINDLLCDSDIFALPSTNETFGLVYLEAAAHQNAVIATKGTGVWGHFIDGEEVFYCDSRASFQKMLHELIDKDDLRNEMATKAYERTKESFTWESVIDRYVSTYRPFLQQS